MSRASPQASRGKCNIPIHLLPLCISGAEQHKNKGVGASVKASRISGAILVVVAASSSTFCIAEDQREKEGVHLTSSAGKCSCSRGSDEM